MAAHRESCEKGAGIVGWHESEKSFIAYRDMSHASMWKAYCKDTTPSPFWVFHSRMPSAGDVSVKNIQPFNGKDTIAFCHNGTYSKDKLFTMLAAMGEFLDGTESDSYLIYRLLKRCHPRTAQAILEEYNQNFVYAHANSKAIYVIGRFKLAMKNSKLIMAWNDWSEPHGTLVCDFEGKIKFFKKEKPFTPTRYFMTEGKEEKAKNSYWKDRCVEPKLRDSEEQRKLNEFLNDTPSPELQADFDHLEGIPFDTKEN